MVPNFYLWIQNDQNVNFSQKNYQFKDVRSSQFKLFQIRERVSITSARLGGRGVLGLSQNSDTADAMEGGYGLSQNDDMMIPWRANTWNKLGLSWAKLRLS